ncbi:hypothetical protein BBD42_26335 [Paenibacillus sp. BIHB 4019]|uniref:DUF3243 domain-containing protein n=1 Tax=Paenibacillus sp. BIHB 4019 TaxID=1870819 RepID=A0A1B2DPG7_9BACL|nr:MULTISPECIES: DUF3243 domain-containing protein [unclassified Paenibacillus]ANY69609.1 hypothetical protein BBD42_26335 [Paenibacillus sp. BIHB 4019]KQO04356.1 hypothetical protein ASF12_12470 [Paenibacillus sp. Leaf72]
MSTVLTNFDTWKQFLADKVQHAKQIGMNDEAITSLAFEIGSFLDEKVDPKNEEQRVLKELWDAGDDSERKVLACLMIKLVQKA